ncbi:MAG: hypothetical protein L0215_22345 [Gemmataceae bacterium]|nr:hypothetical protein [Gemmataceae bacterium]
MACDLVVALNPATADGAKLFGLNCHELSPRPISLRRCAGQIHTPGDVLMTKHHRIPQPRQTWTVLGVGPRDDAGLTHGVNEHQVAMGLARWQSRIHPQKPGLLGDELVRLTLERSRSARQAADTLTDLISRYGQGRFEPGESDHLFLIADPQEAVLVEAAGPYWASLECQHVRAAADAALIRQDWQRLAPGLASLAIQQGWFPDDGHKLDFAGALAEPRAPNVGADSDPMPPTHSLDMHSWALKRWAKATLLLEQQSGHIDLWFLRRMLAEHFETVLTKYPLVGQDSIPVLIGGQERKPILRSVPQMVNTFLAPLLPAADAVPMAWCAFGDPARALYLPVLLDGELPELYADGACSRWLARGLTRQDIDKRQALVDQKAEEFLPQARMLKQQGNLTLLQRLATLFMQDVCDMLTVEPSRTPSRRADHYEAQDLAYVAE